MDDKMGCVCATCGKEERKIWESVVDIKETSRSVDVDVRETIILKCVLKKNSFRI